MATMKRNKKRESNEIPMGKIDRSKRVKID